MGDRRKFLSAFITLKCVIDVETDTPTGRLAPTAKDWCWTVGRGEVETVEDILGGMNKTLNNVENENGFAAKLRHLQDPTR